MANEVSVLSVICWRGSLVKRVARLLFPTYRVKRTKYDHKHRVRLTTLVLLNKNVNN